MYKIFCDICEKEINARDRCHFELYTPMGLNIVIDDMCEECRTTIYRCAKMIKECKWKPDFHEALKSEDVWTRDHAGYILSEIEEEITKIN